MKINKLSIRIGSIGILITLGAFFRLVAFPNYTQNGLAFLGIGIVLIGGAYLYNKSKNNQEDIEDLNRGLDAMKKWANNNFEKLGVRE